MNTAVSGTAQAAKQTQWQLDPAHSAAHFSVRHLMISNVRGDFNKVSGSAVLDMSDPTKSAIEVNVDITSIDTREPQRDDHLRSADFFDVEHHPKVTFSGRFVERTGDTSFKGSADLTIRAVTRAVPLDVSYLGEWRTPFWAGDENRGELRRIGFEALARVNRHDFGVSWQDELPGEGVVVGNEIQLFLDAEAILLDDLRRTGAIEYYAEDVDRFAV